MPRGEGKGFGQWRIQWKFGEKKKKGNFVGKRLKRNREREISGKWNGNPIWFESKKKI